MTRAQKRARAERRKSFVTQKHPPCPLCGERAAHFMPPSGGGKAPGFFICQL